MVLKVCDEGLKNVHLNMFSPKNCVILLPNDSQQNNNKIMSYFSRVFGLISQLSHNYINVNLGLGFRV